MQDPVGIPRLDVLRVHRVAQLQLPREASLRPLRHEHVLTLLVFRATLCSDVKTCRSVLMSTLDGSTPGRSSETWNPSSACHTSIGIPIGVRVPDSNWFVSRSICRNGSPNGSNRNTLTATS